MRSEVIAAAQPTPELPVQLVPALAPPLVRVHSRRRYPSLLTHLALLLICAGFLIPFVWMISTSLKTSSEALVFPPKLIPSPPRWESSIDSRTDETWALAARRRRRFRSSSAGQ